MLFLTELVQLLLPGSFISSIGSSDLGVATPDLLPD